MDCQTVLELVLLMLPHLKSVIEEGFISTKPLKILLKRGPCSLGWLYGFKLHMITNDTGGIIDFIMTRGNVDDRNPLRFKQFISKLYGRLFGDKGHLSKELFTELFSNGVPLMTKLRKNMKTKILTPLLNPYHLRKEPSLKPSLISLKTSVK